MERVEFSSRKAAQRFDKAARRRGLDVRLLGARVESAGPPKREGTPTFGAFARAFLAQRRCSGEYHAD